VKISLNKVTTSKVGVNRFKIMDRTAKTRKVKNIVNLLTFLKTKNPKMAVGISIDSLPTHQLPIPTPKAPKRKIETAAGLKRCFLFIAKIYFDAIAIRPTRAIILKSENVVAGNTKKNNIRAVIELDSTLVWTLKILAKTMFEIKQTTVSMSKV